MATTPHANKSYEFGKIDLIRGHKPSWKRLSSVENSAENVSGRESLNQPSVILEIRNFETIFQNSCNRNKEEYLSYISTVYLSDTPLELAYACGFYLLLV